MHFLHMLCKAVSLKGFANYLSFKNYYVSKMVKVIWMQWLIMLYYAGQQFQMLLFYTHHALTCIDLTLLLANTDMYVHV